MRHSLIEKLGNGPFVELANNTYLFACASPHYFETETLVAVVRMVNNTFSMKLIARVHMYMAQVRVIGTRVFCYENGSRGRKPGNYIIFFDVWNPESVESYVELGPGGRTVRVGQTTLCGSNSKTVKPLESEGNCMDVWNSLF